jgi:hypothetical protein
MPVFAALLLGLAQAPDAATLIVFRDYAEPVLFAPTVVVNGEPVGKLGQKRLIALALPAGQHRIEIRWPMLAMQPPARATVTLRVGAHHYLELSAAAAVGTVRGSSDLVEHDPALGEQAAGCCRPAS